MAPLNEILSTIDLLKLAKRDVLKFGYDLLLDHVKTISNRSDASSLVSSNSTIEAPVKKKAKLSVDGNNSSRRIRPVSTRSSDKSVSISSLQTPRDKPKRSKGSSKRISVDDNNSSRRTRPVSTRSSDKATSISSNQTPRDESKRSKGSSKRISVDDDNTILPAESNTIINDQTVVIEKRAAIKNATPSPVAPAEPAESISSDTCSQEPPPITQSSAKQPIVLLSPVEKKESPTPTVALIDESLPPIIDTCSVEPPLSLIIPPANAAVKLTIIPETGSTSSKNSTAVVAVPVVRPMSKTRPHFFSAERLGGVSRLHLASSGSSNLSSAKGRTNSSSVCSTTVNFKKASTTSSSSKFNLSTNTSLSSSTSGLLTKPGGSTTKQQQVNIRSQLTEERQVKRDERIKAFMEQQQLRREEAKRNNEEHRLAVKKRAQDMIAFESAVAKLKENQPHKPALNRTHNLAPTPSAVSALRPQNPARTAAPHHPMTTMGVKQTLVKTTTATAPQSAQPPRPLNLTNPIASTSTQPAPVSRHVARLVAIQPPPAVADISHGSFNVSMLPSDSDDDDNFKMKTPYWARKGAPELVETMKAMYKGLLKVPDELIPPKKLKFDLPSVFRGWKFSDRPRRSSAVWAKFPNGGHPTGNFNRIV